MSRQYWVAPLPPFHTADGAAYASSATLTDVSPTPQILLPAGALEIGTRLQFWAYGRYSNTGTPTLTLGFYSGTIGQAIASAAALVVTAAVTTVSGAANRTWAMEGRAQVRAVGTSGSVLGVAEAINITTTATDMAPATAPAAVTVDTTVARYVGIGATWGTSSASNTLTVHELGVALIS